MTLADELLMMFDCNCPATIRLIRQQYAAQNCTTRSVMHQDRMQVLRFDYVVWFYSRLTFVFLSDLLAG